MRIANFSSLRRRWIEITRQLSTSNFSTPLNEAEHIHKGNYALLLNKCLDPVHKSTFWGEIANSRIDWISKFNKVEDCHMEAGIIRWFIGGRLNASYNCLDRHAMKNPDKIALLWEANEPNQGCSITYIELLKETCRIANVLKSLGVSKGDRVVIYLPATPTIVASMLACARIGAIHSVVFPGFSAESLASRIKDAGANLVITADHAIRGTKVIELKRIVDQAISSCPEGLVKTVLVQRRTGKEVPMLSRDVYLDKLTCQMESTCEPLSVDSEDPLFLLYTSGSTGSPKGIVHSTAGYLLYAGYTFEQVFDFKPAHDIFGCVADVGWITGHTYVVYGPLFNGGTSLIFESTPTYPDPSRYWATVERHKLTHLYLSPTSLRLLIKHGDEWTKKHDISSLRILGCAGEPLNPEPWNWFFKMIGNSKCEVLDTWWQTETGGVMLSPRPSEFGAEIRAGMPMRPLPGIEAFIVDPQTGKRLSTFEAGRPRLLDASAKEASGALYIGQSWPGMATSIWRDHYRFVQTYFKQETGSFYTGDGAILYQDGSFQITGRMDDVINISGHRLGTAEIESVLNKHPLVAESAAISYPHPIKGEALYVFVTMKDISGPVRHTNLSIELSNLIRQHIAGYAAPDRLQITASGLPKTRSGKIMRRILRKIALGQLDDLGDISTLADPTVVDDLIQNHRLIIESDQPALTREYKEPK